MKGCVCTFLVCVVRARSARSAFQGFVFIYLVLPVGLDSVVFRQEPTVYSIFGESCECDKLSVSISSREELDS